MTEESVKELRDKIARIKLKKQLEQLVPKQESAKVKKEYDPTIKYKNEIKELESKKVGLKGFKGFVQKANINFAINQRRKQINTVNNLKFVDNEIGYLKKRTELEKAREELAQLKKRNRITLEGINTSSVKPLKFEDLY